jgi:chromosome segregation ATPase
MEGRNVIFKCNYDAITCDALYKEQARLIDIIGKQAADLLNNKTTIEDLKRSERYASICSYNNYHERSEALKERDEARKNLAIVAAERDKALERVNQLEKNHLNFNMYAAVCKERDSLRTMLNEADIHQLLENNERLSRNLDSARRSINDLINQVIAAKTSIHNAKEALT